MLAFKKHDKAKIIFKLKFITLRGINHNNKGGKGQILMCERVKGGFATGDISEPIEINLLDFISPLAISLGVNDILAHGLGFESLGEYMEEDYNKSNNSYLRKMYFITNVKPNFENMEV